MTSRKTIAILHYSYPPVVGGVEFIIKGQAEILAKNGYRIKIITSQGETKNRGIQIDLIPEIGSGWPENKLVTEELEQGIISERFQRLRGIIYAKIKRSLEGVKVCLAHNVMTMHFNLALTSALDEIIDGLHHKIRFYLWCHDATLINPDYSVEHSDRHPWNLLRNFKQNATYIAISEWRKKQLVQLFGVSENLIRVIPDGIDIKTFLRISDSVWKMACDKGIFDDDLVMLFPSRILKRKNYELAIRITKELASLGKKCKLLITAPPDPHNPAAKKYYRYLHHLVEEMELKNHVLFLSDLASKYELEMGYQELQDLYRISDLLLITSSQEGFGIPLLEAAAMKLPLACSEIPPLSEITKERALLFKLDDKPFHIARQIIEYLDTQPTYFMFRRIVSRFSWEAIYQDYLKGLVS
ncbi:MAG: glycosyltransferase family 4 protein [bacterium]